MHVLCERYDARSESPLRVCDACSEARSAAIALWLCLATVTQCGYSRPVTGSMGPPVQRSEQETVKNRQRRHHYELRHGRRTAALMSVISALGGRRAAPPKSTELWVGQRPHTPRQCLGVSHLQGKGAQQGMPPSLPLPSNNPLPSNIPYPPTSPTPQHPLPSNIPYPPTWEGGTAGHAYTHTCSHAHSVSQGGAVA